MNFSLFPEFMWITPDSREFTLSVKPVDQNAAVFVWTEYYKQRELQFQSCLFHTWDFRDFRCSVCCWNRSLFRQSCSEPTQVHKWGLSTVVFCHRGSHEVSAYIFSPFCQNHWVKKNHFETALMLTLSSVIERVILVMSSQINPATHFTISWWHKDVHCKISLWYQRDSWRAGD